MIESLALIFLAGLAASALCRKLKIPPVSGMLLTGIVLGPYVLNLLSPSILAVSTDLRQLALIIILLKAGLSLNLRDLKKVGRPAPLCPVSLQPLKSPPQLFSPRFFWGFPE